MFDLKRLLDFRAPALGGAPVTQRRAWSVLFPSVLFLLFLCSSTGCQLIVDFDRSEIVDAGAGDAGTTTDGGGTGTAD